MSAITKNTVTKDQLDKIISESQVSFTNPVGTLTHCAIVLPCGFILTGESACVDPANYNKELGEKYSLEVAAKKLWELEGYLLANDRYRAEQKKNIVVGGSANQEADPNTTENLDFGNAIRALKAGKKVQRAGWNGKGMFLYYVPAANYPMQRNNNQTLKGVFPDDMVPYQHYLALKTAQGTISTWAPSVSDSLADDWMLV